MEIVKYEKKNSEGQGIITISLDLREDMMNNDKYRKIG